MIVCKIKCLPWMNLWNLVNTKIIPSASFSIYLKVFFSAGNSILDAWAIGFHDPSSILCNMQAPQPYELASLAAMIPRSGL